MCGIAGFMGIGSADVINSMIKSISYRGPDVQNVYIDNNIALAHARLSIIDPRPEGNCPMFTPDKKLAIIFNGEIYDFLNLKTELEKKYKFYTNTDTEVLLYLYKEYGVKMLDKISGMFAFAIYDFETKELFIARDRMGKKPLYYTETNSSFIFASELKALMKNPLVDREVNIESINQFLTFDYVPTPNTIIKKIYKLEAANYLIVKNNRIAYKECYWKYNFHLKSSLSFIEAKDKLNDLLNQSVQKRLISDVPLGVFLSGGLDSSTVAYYAQKNSNSRIQTFSIGFEDESYNESDYAYQVARHLNTVHHTEVLTSRDTLNLMDVIYPMVDEPFADASLIPTYFLSKYTKSKVTVALGGDGSDELMAGYPTFISNYFKTPFAYLPSSLHNLLLNLTNHVLPSSDNNISLDFKIKQFLRGFQSSQNHIHQLWLGSFTPDEKIKLFNKECYDRIIDKSGLNIIDNHFNSIPKSLTDFDKLIYYYCQTYLQDDILVKVDRASMFNSLEVRAPFLDKDVVEFLISLPKEFKQKGFESKLILKKLMEGKLPNNIIYRPKKGFGIPISSWIKNEMKNKISEVLFQKDDYFNHEYISKIWSDHQSKRSNNRKLIWNLYMLKYWIYNQSKI